MAKLTDRQRKRIIAEYVEGGVSQRKLAEKYNVSVSTISKILSKKEVVQKCTQKKEENTLSMLEFLESRKDKAQSLMDSIVQSAAGDISKASLRDKMGALKILSEVFMQTRSGEREKEQSALDKIVDGLKDLKDL